LLPRESITNHFRCIREFGTLVFTTLSAASLPRGQVARLVSRPENAVAPPTADRHGTDPLPKERKRARAPPKRVSESLVRRPLFAQLSEEAKGAGRLTVARFDRYDSGALRVSYASRLTTALQAHVARTLRSPTSPAPAPHSWSSAPWVPTPRTDASRTRTPAGGATETVPTSECRRRYEGTGERTFRYCAISWLRKP